VPKFLSQFAVFGTQVPQRTFENWLRLFKAHGTASLKQKKTGRPRLLSAEQTSALQGKLSVDFDQLQKISLSSVQQSVASLTGVDISSSTASRLLKTTDFTLRRVTNKRAAKEVAISQCQNDLLGWAEDQQKNVIPSADLSSIASIDFTFTSHRTAASTTFAPVGQSPKSATTEVPKYTNCIVTMIWADGVNRTPSILFTHNPAFNLQRPLPKAKGPRRHEYKKQKKFIREFCRDNGIAMKRIQYIPPPKGKSTYYIPEGPMLVRRFFQIYEGLAQSLIYSDGENSFKEGKCDVLEDLKHRHITYPAHIHAYLSPNDNNLHGAVKKAWREGGFNLGDDVEGCLNLLSLLDIHTNRSSKDWFQRNILSVNRDNVGLLWGDRSDVERDKRRAESRRIFVLGQKGDFDSTSQKDIPSMLQSDLNGFSSRSPSKRAQNRLQTLKRPRLL